MTTPTNWGQLIASLGAARIYGTATQQTEVSAPTTWTDFAVPFQRGDGMAAGGSGATQGILVQTTGYYLIHSALEGRWTSGQAGDCGMQLVRPRGSDYFPQVGCTPNITAGAAFVDYHHVAQYNAGDVIRMQVAVSGPSPRVRYARITALFLGG